MTFKPVSIEIGNHSMVFLLFEMNVMTGLKRQNHQYYSTMCVLYRLIDALLRTKKSHLSDRKRIFF